MKRIIAVVLAVLMLSGCQLAREEKKEDWLQDQLVGAFVTFEHLELDFDIEGWLNDNPGALEDGEVVLEPGQGNVYQERLIATETEDGWLVSGYEGLSLGWLRKGDYATPVFSEGVCEVSSHFMADDNGDAVAVEGTIYFPAGSEVMLCLNPVYMTEDGEYYVVQGQSFQSTVEKGGSMSQSVSDKKTWTEDGVETVCSAEFKTTVKGVSLAEKVVLVWMGAENVELSRMEYAPGELPESMTAAGDYLIVEEIAGDTITRQLCQSGDETFTVYYQGEQPWCVPDVVTIHWPE